jgi:hypothetical protein
MSYEGRRDKLGWVIVICLTFGSGIGALLSVVIGVALEDKKEEKTHELSEFNREFLEREKIMHEQDAIRKEKSALAKCDALSRLNKPEYEYAFRGGVCWQARVCTEQDVRCCSDCGRFEEVP